MAIAWRQVGVERTYGAVAGGPGNDAGLWRESSVARREQESPVQSGENIDQALACVKNRIIGQTWTMRDHCALLLSSRCNAHEQTVGWPADSLQCQHKYHAACVISRLSANTTNTQQAHHYVCVTPKINTVFYVLLCTTYNENPTQQMTREAHVVYTTHSGQ